MSRFHTAGRRQPDLIGKDTNGNRIPGGPYTVLQLGVFLVLLVVLWTTKGLWAAGRSGLATVGITVGVAVIAAVVVQRLDFGGQNPFYLAASYLGGFGVRRPPGHRDRPAPARTVTIHAAAPNTPETSAEPSEQPAASETGRDSLPEPRLDPVAASAAATGSALEQFLAAGRRMG